MSATRLLEALEAAGRALEAGDVMAASEAMGRAEQARLALQETGQRLTPEELGRARELHAACKPAMDRLQQRLAQALDRSGRSHRAVDAYRR